MDLISWFGEQSGLVSTLQVLLDLVLIIVVVATIKQSRRNKVEPPDGATGLIESLERVIQETQNIGADFDQNLQERQLLIQQMISKLDQRIREAQQLCVQLESLSKTPAREVREQHPASQVSPIQPSPALISDHQKVLQLARKGLNAEAIAKRLQKPLGEVELILNLQRLSSSR
jgi:DNA-directed RNA polymerase specialized sigma24 family protein